MSLYTLSEKFTKHLNKKAVWEESEGFSAVRTKLYEVFAKALHIATEEGSASCKALAYLLEEEAKSVEAHANRLGKFERAETRANAENRKPTFDDLEED